MRWTSGEFDSDSAQRRHEARFAHLEFPVFVLDPPAFGMIGQWAGSGAKSVGYSVQLLDGSGRQVMEVTTWLHGFEGDTWTWEESVVPPRPHPGEDPEPASRPVTVLVDRREVVGVLEEYRGEGLRFGWAITVIEGGYVIAARGEGDPPVRLALAAATDMGPYVAEFREFWKRTYG